MRIADLLLEDRVDFLRNRYLPVIGQRAKSLGIPADIRSQIARLPGATPEERIFNWLVSRDPTPNRQYLGWILACAADRAVPFEDLEHLPETLAKYHQRKRTNRLPAEARDINRIKTPSELDVLLRDASNTEVAADEAEATRARQESDILLDDGSWLVLIPRTEFAAQYWGRGTQWCTAWGDPRGLHPTRTCWFDEYNQNGPMVIVINKTDPSERYQFHRASGQYMDRNDKPVDPNVLVRLGRANPALARVLIPHVPVMAAAFGNEKQQLEVVQRDGEAIRWIDNPSEAVKMAAVRRDGWAIRWIDNPTEAVKMAAVRRAGEAIQFIEDPSEAVQLAAINRYTFAIQYIKNPTEAVQRAAVRQHGENIQWIEDPSEDLQLEAVRKNSRYIQYIKNPTEAVQLAAVRQHGWNIQKIANPSPAAIELARQQGFDRQGRPI